MVKLRSAMINKLADYGYRKFKNVYLSNIKPEDLSKLEKKIPTRLKMKLQQDQREERKKQISEQK